MPSVNQIRKYPLFNDLNEDELAHLANVMVRRSFAKGAYIFYPGSPGINAYFIESGMIRQFFSTASGEEILIHLTGPLEVFGLPTLDDSLLRITGAAALKPSVLYSIGREDFFQLLYASPRFVRNVYMEMFILARKLGLNTRTLTTLNLNGRLATILLRLAGKSTKKEQQIIHMPISQEMLAGWLGASRGRLNQAMRLLQQMGLIVVEGQNIIILDYPGLVRVSEEQTLEEV